MKVINKVKQGKKNRKQGAIFEKLVRSDLESKGYTVCKWVNNIDLEQNKLVSAKPAFNPFTKSFALARGFPDYIAFKRNVSLSTDSNILSNWVIIGVESKRTGYLDKIEKQKKDWYIQYKTFDIFWIAYPEGDNVMYK